MAKTKRIVILFEPAEYDRIVEVSRKTGVPYAEVGRRLFANWLATGELPPLVEDKEVKPKTKRNTK